MPQSAEICVKNEW